MSSLSENPFFDSNNLDQPISEIYHLLPSLQQTDLSTRTQQVAALQHYLASTNESILQGLKSVTGLLASATCCDEFHVSPMQLMNLADLISVNLDLVMANSELANAYKEMAKDKHVTLEDMEQGIIAGATRGVKSSKRTAK